MTILNNLLDLFNIIIKIYFKKSERFSKFYIHLPLRYSNEFLAYL